MLYDITFCSDYCVVTRWEVGKVFHDDDDGLPFPEGMVDGLLSAAALGLALEGYYPFDDMDDPLVTALVTIWGRLEGVWVKYGDDVAKLFGKPLGESVDPFSSS